jgi:hypothetical protein
MKAQTLDNYEIKEMGFRFNLPLLDSDLILAT